MTRLGLLKQIQRKNEPLKRIAELEQENTELKKQNIKDCENFNKTMSETKERWNKEHYQLAKAKEVIETLVDSLTIAIDDERVRELTIVKEAEQFLKEVKE